MRNRSACRSRRSRGTERVAIVGYGWPPEERAFETRSDGMNAASGDAALEVFLAAGEPPVYVGFGSMLGFDRERLLRIVVDALDGPRALVFGGWSGFGAGTLPATHAKLTARSLRERLDAASSAGMRARSCEVARSMAGEHGIAEAVRRIEGWVPKRTRG
jgi:UDP:flavonoid glycosyltransferase YjiC (YdhE family)